MTHPGSLIITGASSGIGEALAYEAAKKGYRICLAARNIDQLNRVKSNCLAFCQEVLVVQADVRVEADCKKIIDETVQAFGGVDVLINNAGISMRALLKDCDISVLKQVMEINFWGAVYCTKFALPYLLQSKGSVVGVSSIAGIKGLPARTGYSASKFALNGFLEALRIENRKTGLHVLIACPGYTASNIRNAALNQKGKSQSESPYEESKLMSAETVAGKIFKALDQRKATVYMTLEGKLTLLLNKFFPRFLDRLVYNKIASEKDSPFK